MASISPASAASLRVFGVICMPPRGLTEIEPRFIPIFGWLVHWNAVMRTQRGDALACPAVAMTRDEAIPVEDAGDHIIIGDQHELANDGNHIGCRGDCADRGGVWQTHLAVDAADPMDHENDLGRLGVDIGRHLLDHGAYDTLL